MTHDDKRSLYLACYSIFGVQIWKYLKSIVHVVIKNFKKLSKEMFNSNRGHASIKPNKLKPTFFHAKEI